MRGFSSLDHLPSTEDMIGTHGLPSCLFGFFTRRTRNGGKRMGFFTMMDETDWNSARRGPQFRMDGLRILMCSGPSQRSRSVLYVLWGVPGVWARGRQNVLPRWSSCRGWSSDVELLIELRAKVLDGPCTPCAVGYPFACPPPLLH